MLQSAERVYDYLCQHLNESVQPPSKAKIAADLRMKPTQVARALFWLEDAGKIHPGSTMPRHAVYDGEPLNRRTTRPS